MNGKMKYTREKKKKKETEEMYIYQKPEKMW